jgi:WD40 repeat protein
MRSDGKLPLRLIFVDEGRGILTLPSDRELAWLDATTGALVRKLQTGLTSVLDLFLTPDENAIVAIGPGGLEAWDARSGTPRGTGGDPDAELAAFVTDDQSRILMANSHYLLACWPLPRPEQPSWSLRQPDLASRIAVAPGGAHFALAQADGLISVWRLPARPPVNAGSGLSGGRLALSPDGRLAMLVGTKVLHTGDSATRVEDWAAGRSGPDLTVNGIVHGGAISPDGRHVVTLSSPEDTRFAAKPLEYPAGSNKGWVQFWDWEQGTEARERLQAPSEPFSAAFSPDGRRLVVFCAGGEALWIDPADGQVLHTRRPKKLRGYAPGWPDGDQFRISPDGKLLVHWNHWGEQLVLIDALTGLDRSPALPPQPQVLDGQFSLDSRYLATAGADKTVQVWDLATGKAAGPSLAHADWVFQANFSADGSWLVTGCRDGTARVWDWRRGRPEGFPLMHQGEVQNAYFWKGDRWLLTKCSGKAMNSSVDNGVQIWDWRAGKPLTPCRRIPSGWGASLLPMPDQSHAVLGRYPNAIQFLSLDEWVDGSDPRFPPDHLREIVELISGQRIVGGSTVISLTTAEWAERWRTYRASKHAGAR